MHILRSGTTRIQSHKSSYLCVGDPPNVHYSYRPSVLNSHALHPLHESMQWCVIIVSCMSYARTYASSCPPPTIHLIACLLQTTSSVVVSLLLSMFTLLIRVHRPHTHTHARRDINNAAHLVLCVPLIYDTLSSVKCERTTARQKRSSRVLRLFAKRSARFYCATCGYINIYTVHAYNMHA